MSSLKFIALLALMNLVAFGGWAAAHEVRPAYLEINQGGTGRVIVLWKQPTLGDLAIHLRPLLSNDWLNRAPTDSYAAGGYLIRYWDIPVAHDRELANVQITIEGLADTLTDVLLRVKRPGLSDFQAILRPEQPSVRIPSNPEKYGSRLDFLWLGIRHILTGPDHLLFVFGLLLIIPGWTALLRTITAFTVAHSITLAASSLWRLNLPLALLDALVALSILFLAPEVLRARRHGDSFTLRRPWIAAFTFGLLHGLAFSTGLTPLELGGADLASALLLFNLGVEIGQLGFVILVLAAAKFLELTKIRWPTPIKLLPAYVVGSLGAFWMLQNLSLAFAVSR